MDPRFIRTSLLLGEEAIANLNGKKVAIFGLGGVGGGCLEALARSGIGHFILVDADEIEISNFNRQNLATESALGNSKVEEGKKRILSINIHADVKTYRHFYLPGQEGGIDLSGVDYVFDCIDTIAAKNALIDLCFEKGIPLISCLGVGKRMDPTKLCITDIHKTSGDPLAKLIRKHCREKGIASLPVVTSTEPPMAQEEHVESEERRRDIPGSTPFVPPVAGYFMAYYAVNDLLKKGGFC